MATEILVNDGGAPARILPFTANHALSGGHVVKIHTDGKVQKTAAGGKTTIGVALTDAAADAPMSVISGHGVILNVYVKGTAASGALLEVVDTGILGTGSGTEDGDNVAIAIEAGPGGSDVALKKVLMRY